MEPVIQFFAWATRLEGYAGNRLLLSRTASNSEFVHQVAHPHSQRLGNSHERRNAGGFLATFQFADIDRVQIGFFRQLFLAQFGGLAKFANGVANDFLMLLGFFHAFSGKQEAGRSNTVHSPLFHLASGEETIYKLSLLQDFGFRLRSVDRMPQVYV